MCELRGPLPYVGLVKGIFTSTSLLQHGQIRGLVQKVGITMVLCRWSVGGSLQP